MKSVRRVVLLAIAMVMTLIPATPGGAADAPSELFISEYIEGSSNNKALEIYNGTGAAIDLAAGSYAIEMYSNGSMSAGLTINLSGTVGDGDVFVLAQSSADPAVLAQADQTNGAGWFNGNDVVVLRKGTSAVDAIGQIGNSATYAANVTLRRMASVCAGDTNPNDAFDASAEWDSYAQNTFEGLGAHTATCGGGTGTSDPVINEFVANHTGADSEAFVEVLGAPSTDYSAFTVLELEGDSASNEGTIDAVLPVTATSADGYWVDPEDMENGTITILLVEGFTGSLGQDLDANDDGTFDVTPWTRVVDDVAVTDGGGSDVAYSSTVLGPFFDGQPFGAGGASRIPNGTDTDTAADWVRNDFDGFGFPGFVGSQAIGEAVNTPGATNVVITVIVDPEGVCGDPATFIHDIQGSGLASDDIGNIREIEGVVVGDFQDDVGTNGDLNGFHVQEEDSDADGNTSTSEGIFVFQGSNPTVDVANGDVVRVRGTVTEFNGLTEITSVESVLVCGTGTASAAVVTLPVASIDDFEAFEGMAVTFPQSLTITEFFNFDRFGEIVLATDRQFQPTAVSEPGSVDAANLADLNSRSRITLDDGRTSSNPDPAIHPNGAEFDLDNLFRGGDLVTDATGVMDFAFGSYKVQPTQGADYTAVNDRPATPEPVGGSLTVASFNVLNYFNTLDYPSGDPRDNACGPNQDQGCRGADNENERTRQLDKIVAAMAVMDTDVLGIIEVENTTGVEAMDDIVGELNDIAGPGTYDYIDTGTVGDDVIKVGFIYQPGSVTPVGDFAVLDDPAFVAPFGVDRNRAALAQTFVENATGGKFTAVVNHFKSKGSPCGPGDDDPETGSCNLTRTVSAQVLADWLETDPTGSGDPDVMIIGDLNSYDKEDPIDVLTAEGYVDLLGLYQGEFAYSFVFSGQLGYLDYGMANASLASQVTGTTAWAINADEPDLIDYDTSFKRDAQDAIYAPDQYRSSDHDPVIVGLDLNASPSCDTAEPSIGSIWPPNHKMVDVEILGCTDADGDSITITIDSLFQDEPVNADDDGNTAPDGDGIGTSIARVRAERNGEGDGRVYHIGFTATDAFGNTTTGEVTVEVRLSRNQPAVDGGAVYDSTIVP